MKTATTIFVIAIAALSVSGSPLPAPNGGKGDESAGKGDVFKLVGIENPLGFKNPLGIISSRGLDSLLGNIGGKGDSDEDSKDNGYKADEDDDEDNDVDKYLKYFETDEKKYEDIDTKKLFAGTTHNKNKGNGDYEDDNDEDEGYGDDYDDDEDEGYGDDSEYKKRSYDEKPDKYLKYFETDDKKFEEHDSKKLFAGTKHHKEDKDECNECEHNEKRGYDEKPDQYLKYFETDDKKFEEHDSKKLFAGTKHHKEDKDECNECEHNEKRGLEEYYEPYDYLKYFETDDKKLEEHDSKKLFAGTTHNKEDKDECNECEHREKRNQYDDQQKNNYVDNYDDESKDKDNDYSVKYSGSSYKQSSQKDGYDFEADYKNGDDYDNSYENGDDNSYDNGDDNSYKNGYDNSYGNGDYNEDCDEDGYVVADKYPIKNLIDGAKNSGGNGYVYSYSYGSGEGKGDNYFHYSINNGNGSNDNYDCNECEKQQ